MVYMAPFIRLKVSAPLYYMFVLFALICAGLLGASMFTTGIIFSITPLTATGIILLALAVASMTLWYVYKTPPNQGMMTIERQIPVVAYTTNNMNTMKRNKSDTDLELINRESQGV
jgi:hypothetical protein